MLLESSLGTLFPPFPSHRVRRNPRVSLFPDAGDFSAALGAATVGNHVLSHMESVPVNEEFLALVAEGLLSFISREVPGVDIL